MYDPDSSVATPRLRRSAISNSNQPQATSSDFRPRSSKPLLSVPWPLSSETMLRLKLYYHAKPFLPWRLRMATRRFFAKRKRIRYSGSWPIDPLSGSAPEGWKGWPSGAAFAFALSHDVETQIGYDKLDKLVEIEEQLGFRSVINFIPEGEYRVSEKRIQELKDRGFEVGVHGLCHDGKRLGLLLNATGEDRPQIDRDGANGKAVAGTSPSIAGPGPRLRD